MSSTAAQEESPADLIAAQEADRQLTRAFNFLSPSSSEPAGLVALVLQAEFGSGESLEDVEAEGGGEQLLPGRE